MSQDLERCRQFLRSRAAQRSGRLDRRFERAWEDAQNIIDLIRTKYRPKRIYQWGSLLERRRFWERSDIDIAVEGIRYAEEFFPLLRDADRLASLPLDIVQLEKVEPEFADIIRTRGKLVYEREGADPDAAE